MLRRILYLLSEIYQSCKHSLPAAQIEVIRATLVPGDLILLHAPFLERLMPGYWTHVAVYAGHVRGEESAVQARFFGVHRIPLAKLMRTQHAAILRPHASTAECEDAVLRALALCGRPFDYFFDFEDPRRLVCSEIPLLLYGETLGLQMRTIRFWGWEKKIFLPDDLFSKGFDVVWVSPGAPIPYLGSERQIVSEELHGFITGRVQMVMFRDFLTRTARRLALRGWVRNLSDGRVEFIAQGERSALERLLAKAHKGPLLARVDRVDTEFRAPRSREGRFEIRY